MQVAMAAACTIRKATKEDFVEIRRLLVEANIVDAPELGSKVYVLVLDAPDSVGLAAAAFVLLEGRKGKLSLLAVDKRYAGLGIEERLIGVSESLCRALGVRPVGEARMSARGASAHMGK